MGIALIKIKLMPSSPDVDLEAIKEKAKEVITSNQGQNPVFEEEPVAFGLIAVIIGFSLDESIELEQIEAQLKKSEDISSVQVIDMRRAFG